MTEPDSLISAVSDYYAARAPLYEATAGYTDSVAERLRAPIKARYQEMYAGHTVLEIACGTGHWTRVIAEVAESVLAVDVNLSPVAIARHRCRHLSNVEFQVAGAYTLEGVPAAFSSAFGIWWWSHVPQRRIAAFLATLHSKLRPGALVLFADQLLYDAHFRRQGACGDTIEQRSLPDGRVFEIVKNFPSEQDVRNALSGMADNVRYLQRSDESSWSVTYNTKG